MRLAVICAAALLAATSAVAQQIVSPMARTGPSPGLMPLVPADNAAAQARLDLSTMSSAINGVLRQRGPRMASAGVARSAPAALPNSCETATLQAWRWCVGQVERKIAGLPAAARADPELTQSVASLRADLAGAGDDLGQVTSERLRAYMVKISIVQAAISTAMQRASTTEQTVIPNTK